MKTLILIISLITVFLVGCSSTYRISDFSSRDKFYEDFNESVKDKYVKVTLANDSSLNFNYGVELINDTLYSIGYNSISQYRKIALLEINNIIYTSLDYKSGNILLKNGGILKAEKINNIPDSVQFFEKKTITIRDNISNITKVKEVIYNKHWPGIIPGIITGFLGSFAIAGLGETFSRNSDSGYFATGAAIFIGVPVGTILGGVVGWFLGYDCIYQFNR